MRPLATAALLVASACVCAPAQAQQAQDTTPPATQPVPAPPAPAPAQQAPAQPPSTAAPAQSAQPATPSTVLPPVDVIGKKDKPAPAKAAAARAEPKEKPKPVQRAAVKRQPAPVAQPVPAAAPATIPVASDSNGNGQEDPKGHVNGVIATAATSGTKTGTPIIETPQGISVVTADQIAAQGATSIGAATRYSPGIRAESFGDDNRNDWFIIRGFSAQETGLYLDGLQLFSTAFATWKLEPQGLERIEIIRGPSSVLYGGGNPGGLVNAVSKRPDPDAKQSVTVGVDEWGNTYGAADLGGRIAGVDGAFWRLNVLGRIGDTQVDDVKNDRAYVAPTLAFKIDDATKMTVIASYQYDKTAIQNFLPYVGTVVAAPFGKIPTSLNTNNPDYGSFKREQFNIGYEVEHKFSEDLAFRQNFRYGHLEVDLLGLYGGGYASPPTAGSASLTRYNFITTPSVDQFTVDNQLEYLVRTGPLSHKILVGLDYKNYSIDDNQGFSFGTTLDLVHPIYTAVTAPSTRYILGNITQQQTGIYLQDQIKIEKLTIALSGRHDWVTTDRTDDLSGGAKTSGDDSAFTGRAGAIYNFDNGLAPYIAYSTSFNPLVGTNGLTGKLLEPESGKGWEGGVKFEPKGSKLRLTASYFDISRTNVPVTIYTPAFATNQTGEQSSKGWEFEALATPVPGLNLIASYTNFDLKVVNDLNTTAIGKVPAGIPTETAAFWFDYTLQSGPLKGFGGSLGARYVGKSYADVANTLAVPSVWLGDAALHYEWGNNWKVALNVTNFTDEAYVSSCSDANSCFYGERRKALLSATYKW